jgi:hypothetical protein
MYSDRPIDMENDTFQNDNQTSTPSERHEAADAVEAAEERLEKELEGRLNCPAPHIPTPESQASQLANLKQRIRAFHGSVIKSAPKAAARSEAVDAEYELAVKIGEANVQGRAEIEQQLNRFRKWREKDVEEDETRYAKRQVEDRELRAFLKRKRMERMKVQSATPTKSLGDGVKKEDGS